MDEAGNTLGDYLRDRRAKLDPAQFGLPLERRRTPGLRREEVAQRAHVSPTWYTWLEQGRGGAPSEDVLERLARALALSDDEREHLFLLAQGRPPKAPLHETQEVTPLLQRVLDAFADSPAIIKTADWTVLAWNRAATLVLADYPKIPPERRNVLKLLFADGGHDHLPDWMDVARTLVESVRRDVMRAGMTPSTHALIDELSASSADFRSIWAERHVQGHGEGFKRVIHPVAGPLSLEYSTFALDGRPDLALVVFNPATDGDRERVRRLLGSRST